MADQDSAEINSNLPGKRSMPPGLRELAAYLSCPKDISVLGVDDVGQAAYLLPRLTTAAQPLEQMGAAAVEQLIARLQQPHRAHPRRVVFPMSLQVRESTARAPGGRELSPEIHGNNQLAEHADLVS